MTSEAGEGQLVATEAQAAGVWRVVERSGAVHGLRVEPSRCPIADDRFTHVALSVDDPGFWSGPSPMGAVVRFAETSGWDVAEIVAPGELTRAEAIDAAVRRLTRERDEAVRAEREACAALCDRRAAALDALVARHS